MDLGILKIMLIPELQFVLVIDSHLQKNQEDFFVVYGEYSKIICFLKLDLDLYDK